MTHKEIRNMHTDKIITSHILLVVIIFIAIPRSMALTREVDSDKLYQHLVSGDICELREKGKDMIAEKPDSSIMYFSAVAARYSDALGADEKEACIGSLNNLGYIYFYEYNNPVKAFDYLLKSLKLSEETGDNTTLPHIYLNMANVYASMGEGVETVKYLKKSIHSSAVQKAHDILVIAFVGLLNQIYVAEEAPLSSISSEIDIFLNSTINPSTELYEYATLFLKGIEQSDRNDYESAIQTFRQALNSIDSRYTPERYGFIIGSAIAKIQLRQGNLEGALNNYRSILANNSAPDVRISVYSQLSEAFKKTGNIDSSNYYSRLYLELSDSILHRGQLQTLHGLDTQYMTDKLNAHIEQATRDRRYYIGIVVIVSVALVIILALGLWAWGSRRRLINANRLLYEKSRRDLLESEPQTPSAGKAGGLPEKEVLSETHDKESDANDPEEKETGDPDSDAREAEEYDPELAAKIIEVFSSSRDVFSQEFSLERLAYLVGASERRVSRCLNDSMGTNFINEVQKSRIREACRLFEDEKASSTLTIMAISDMVGFKSRSNFVQVFKKLTGLTPSQYQKISRDRH